MKHDGGAPGVTEAGVVASTVVASTAVASTAVVSTAVVSTAVASTVVESAVEPPSVCDVAVVGGGILGLAVARELTRRDPRRSVCVLEREARLGAHQTGHNSGVVHAGVYYAPGSLKARLCVEGARELYAYCEQRGIPHRRCGKLIVAADASELGRLDELERRGRANGVPGLRRVDAAGIRALEPHAGGVAALHSPATGIVDFAAVASAYAEEAVTAGAVLVTGCAVEGLDGGDRRGAVGRLGGRGLPGRGLRIAHSRGVTEAGHAILCAGAWSDRLAVAAGADPDPRIVPFRGAYLRLTPERADLVRGLIYPVPDPGLPFLGVHLTRSIDGGVLIGPTALPAGARDAYDLRRLRGGDLWEAVTWPGTWRMFARWWRSGAREIRLAASRAAFVAAAARYIPELRPGDVEPAFAGIRAQALARDGSLVDDFAFSLTDRALHVRNAPSPAATSSLAIARYVCDRAERDLGLG